MRRLFLVALIAALALVVLSSGTPAEAQTKSLYWKRYDVDVTVQPNGDLRVIETQEIAFLGGPFHYGFRVIPGDRLDGLADIREHKPIHEVQPPCQTEIEHATYYMAYRRRQVAIGPRHPAVCVDERNREDPGGVHNLMRDVHGETADDAPSCIAVPSSQR